jgi:hypothetical protein
MEPQAPPTDPDTGRQVKADCAELAKHLEPLVRGAGWPNVQHIIHNIEDRLYARWIYAEAIESVALRCGQYGVVTNFLVGITHYHLAHIFMVLTGADIYTPVAAECDPDLWGTETADTAGGAAWELIATEADRLTAEYYEAP